MGDAPQHVCHLTHWGGAQHGGEKHADQGQKLLDGTHKAGREFVDQHTHERGDQHHLKGGQRQALCVPMLYNVLPDAVCNTHNGQWCMVNGATRTYASTGT